jgi:oligoendopeptidase F
MQNSRRARPFSLFEHMPESLPRWDLSLIYSTDTDRAADEKRIVELASAFAAAHRGKIAGLSDAELEAVLEEHRVISNMLSRLFVHAYLTFASNTASTDAQALVARTEELGAGVRASLVFFDLELGRLPEREFTGNLAQYSYYISRAQKRSKHDLTEDLETYGIEKNLTGISAFTSLFDEVMGQLSFEAEDADGKTKKFTQETALALMHSPDRALRTRIYGKFLDTVGEQKTVLSAIYNNVLLDHRLDYKRRKYSGPMEARHLYNQVSGKAVRSMLNLVEAHYELARRYYRWKAKIAGIDAFTNADIYAPLFASQAKFSFEEAKSVVLDAYTKFDNNAGRLVSGFFSGSRVDAEVRDAKRPGAFCYGASPELDAFVHINYTGDIRSVQTLAHELGHGLHHQLAMKQNHLSFDVPLVTAETASVFGEILVNELLLTKTQGQDRLALLCAQIEGVLATVFRQTVLTRFEEKAHAEREKERVAPDRFCELWLDVNGSLYGDAVRMVEPYRWGWAYIPHFFHTPFYCYAYSFGQLVVLSLYEQYLKNGPAFVGSYLELLSLGGSRAPVDLVKGAVGLSIEDDAFWAGGLSYVERMIERVEAEAAAPGGVFAGKK